MKLLPKLAMLSQDQYIEEIRREFLDRGYKDPHTMNIQKITTPAAPLLCQNLCFAQAEPNQHQPIVVQHQPSESALFVLKGDDKSSELLRNDEGRMESFDSNWIESISSVKDQPFFVNGKSTTDCYFRRVVRSDSNRGTNPHTPCKSLAVMRQLSLRPGDGLLLKSEVVLDEQVYISVKGSADATIVVVKYDVLAYPIEAHD